jgi:hypothetical protein
MDDFVKGQGSIKDHPTLDKSSLGGDNRSVRNWEKLSSKGLSNEFKDDINQAIGLYCLMDSALGTLGEGKGSRSSNERSQPFPE